MITLVKALLIDKYVSVKYGELGICKALGQKLFLLGIPVVCTDMSCVTVTQCIMVQCSCRNHIGVALLV